MSLPDRWGISRVPSKLSWDIRLTSFDSERDMQRRADDDRAVPLGGCLEAVEVFGSFRDTAMSSIVVKALPAS